MYVWLNHGFPSNVCLVKSWVSIYYGYLMWRVVDGGIIYLMLRYLGIYLIFAFHSLGVGVNNGFKTHKFVNGWRLCYVYFFYSFDFEL